MWICLNDGFISIVEPSARDVPVSERTLYGKGWQDKLLMVRARKRIHLTRHFNKRVYQWRNRDYQFRLFIPRDEAASAIAGIVAGISYPNFKSSVREEALHDAYMGVWSTMNRYGNGGFERRGLGHVAGRYFDEGFRLDTSPMRHRCESCGVVDGHTPTCPDQYPLEPPCGAAGCTEDHPCMGCLTEVLTDRCGDFDSGDDRDGDEGALSHLRVPPL